MIIGGGMAFTFKKTLENVKVFFFSFHYLSFFSLTQGRHIPQHSKIANSRSHGQNSPMDEEGTNIRSGTSQTLI